MRRAALFLTLLIAAITPVQSIDINLSDALSHAEWIRDRYPRPEASANEQALIEYLQSAMAAAGVLQETLTFESLSDAHSFSRVIVATVPGTLRDAGTLVVVVPLNSEDDAPPDLDGAASLGAALAVLEALGEERATPDVRFVFAGAETGPGSAYPLGSRLFLERFGPQAPSAVLYVDADGSPYTVEAGGDGSVAPSWLVERTVSVLGSLGSQPEINPSLFQLYRLGVAPVDRALSTYLEQDVPAIRIGSTGSGLSAPSLEAASAELASFIGQWIESFPAGVPTQWDRHYLYFRIGNRQFFLREQVFLIALLTLLLASLLYALILRRQFSRYVRTVGRNLWNIPALYLLIFGFLTAATYLVDLSVTLRNFPTIWQFYPGAYLVLKLVLALFLFALVAQFIRVLPLSKNGSFYSAATLFVLLVDIILFSIINLSVGFYFMWAFLFAFLFSLARSRLVKVISLLIAPIFLVRVALEVIRVEALEVANIILLTTRGDLLLAFVLLPILLMIIRLDFLIRHPVRGRRSFALRITSLVSGVVVVGTTAFVLLNSPFDATRPQPLAAVEVVDYPGLERRLILESPAPIGGADVTFARQEYTISDVERSTTLVSQRLPDVLSARLTYSTFLDRERAELVISAPQPVDDLRIVLSSASPLILYDANFPLRVAPDQLSGEILVGRRPDLPLTVVYTLSADTLPAVEITATSSVHPDPLVIRAAGIEASTSLEIRSRLGR